MRPEGLEPSRLTASDPLTTIAFATKAIKEYPEDTHAPLLKGYLGYSPCLWSGLYLNHIEILQVDF